MIGPVCEAAADEDVVVDVKILDVEKLPAGGVEVGAEEEVLEAPPGILSAPGV